MDEIEEKLGKLLKDPAAMDSIAKMAQQLIGSSEDGAESPASSVAGRDSGLGISPAMLRVLGKLKEEPNGNRHQLLLAMEPYLKQERRQKLKRAIKLARLARLARLAMTELGGEELGL